MTNLTNKRIAQNEEKSPKYISFFDTDQLKRDMKQRAIRGGMITWMSQGVLFSLGIASTMVLARLVIPEHFGLIGMVTALTVLIDRFEDLGLGDAVVQKDVVTHEQVSTLFWLNIGICTAFSIIVALCSRAVAWFYSDPRLVWITVAFSSNFICSGLSIQHQALIRRRMRFDHFALIKVVSAGFGIGLAIALAWLGYGYWALVWKELARSFISTTMAWSLCRWRPGLPVWNCGIQSMLKFGGSITAYKILYTLSNNLDSILLGRFCGAIPVGLYSRAKQLTAVPVNQLLEPIRYVSLPTFSALQKEALRYRVYFEKTLAIISFLFMPIIIYVSIYSHPIVYLALGPKWMQVVPIFRLLTIPIFLSPVIIMLGLIMLSLGHTKRYFFWGLFNCVSTIIAYGIGIRWGVIGIAASWPVVAAIYLTFSLFYVFWNTPVGISSVLKSIYRPLIASFVMGIILYISYSFLSSYHIALQMILSILLGAGVYFAVWLIFPDGKKSIIEYASYPLSALRRQVSA
jgi:O-antigen/teichoic acid export membrane protein